MVRSEYLILHQTALSSAGGVAQLKREYPGDGGATLESDPARADVLTVNKASIDELIISEGSPVVAYVKCDVEGHELKIFQGVFRTIDQYKPLIQVEVSVESDEAVALFELFEKFGYAGTMVLDE